MISLKMDKVVIDTNVFISGLLFGGNPERVLNLWIEKKFILCISPELQAEIVNKLIAKFHASDTFIKNLVYFLENGCEKYIPQRKVTVVRDKNDNFLLDLALAADAKYLITGDKDLLNLNHYQNTYILSPRDFLTSYSVKK